MGGLWCFDGVGRCGVQWSRFEQRVKKVHSLDCGEGSAAVVGAAVLRFGVVLDCTTADGGANRREREREKTGRSLVFKGTT